MRKIKYQRIPVTVSQANEEVQAEADTDKSYRSITGIAHVHTDTAALKKTHFTKFEINNIEIFEDGHEVILLSCGIEVPPRERFMDKIDEPAGGNKVLFKYKDGGSAAAYPYTASIYLRLENPVE